MSPTNAASFSESSADVIRDEVIPAKAHLGLPLGRGQILRIIDVEGKQVPDITFFNRNDISERYSWANSWAIAKRWLLTTGDVLYSDEANAMFTIVGDTVGIHHSSGGYCNEGLNYRRYGIRGTRNCRENLALAAAPLGISEKEVPGAFCPFMNVVFDKDGSAEILEPISRPGDYIDLRAEMDLFVAISNCPQDKNPCNGFNPTALRIQVFSPLADGSPPDAPTGFRP